MKPKVRVLAFLLLGFAGCSGIGIRGPRARGELVAPALPSTDLVTGDPVLARAVAVRDVESAVRGGLLAVSFELVNRSADELLFEYRFDWTDAEGTRIEDPSGTWTPIVLAGSGAAPVRASAPGPGAVRWTLGVRPSGR
ncbi:MAG TPA: DUF1425 domain-containing protein [Planctomycetota bacterium]|jgi:uncharacterized protein YcfL|nr:DUF1425 domain-containing protein [Planctomycetota bacterium]